MIDDRDNNAPYYVCGNNPRADFLTCYAKEDNYYDAVISGVAAFMRHKCRIIVFDKDGNYVWTSD